MARFVRARVNVVMGGLLGKRDRGKGLDAKSAGDASVRADVGASIPGGGGACQFTAGSSGGMATIHRKMGHIAKTAFFR